MLEAAALSLLILGDSLSTDLPHLVAGGGTPYSVVVAERSDGATTNAAVWTLVPEPDAFALHAAALLVLIFHRALHTVAPTGALRPGTGSARAPWRDERSAQAKAFSTTSRAQT